MSPTVRNLPCGKILTSWQLTRRYGEEEEEEEEERRQKEEDWVFLLDFLPNIDTHSGSPEGDMGRRGEKKERRKGGKRDGGKK